jgi:predicted dinucleotide-binding enzyme
LDAEAGMKIGVQGSGDVGKVLAAGFKAKGHDVVIGTRDAAKLKDYSADKGVAVKDFAGTAAHGELIVLAVSGAAVEAVIQAAGGAAAFAGKTLIDPTNPLDFSTGAPQLFVGTTDSLGERIQRWLPQAKVVKAFNTMGNGRMIDPQLKAGIPTHFIAGDDEAAKAKVGALLKEAGWADVQDLGPISASRWLEALCMAWVMVMAKNQSYGHAFALLRD